MLCFVKWRHLVIYNGIRVILKIFAIFFTISHVILSVYATNNFHELLIIKNSLCVFLNEIKKKIKNLIYLKMKLNCKICVRNTENY